MSTSAVEVAGIHGCFESLNALRRNVWGMQVESGKVDLVADAKGFYERMMHTLPEFLESSDIQNIPQRLQSSMHALEAARRSRAAAHHQNILEREASAAIGTSELLKVAPPARDDAGAARVHEKHASVDESQMGAVNDHGDGVRPRDVVGIEECTSGVTKRTEDPEIKAGGDGDVPANGRKAGSSKC